MKTNRSNRTFDGDISMDVCDSKQALGKHYKFTTSHYVYNERFNTSKVDLMTKNCFWNQCFDKSRLKNFVLWFLLNHGEHKTVQLVEQLKTLGFKHATRAGISLGIDDLKIPPKKTELILEAEKLTLLTVNEYKRGEITGVERFQRLIDTWHRTSERLKQEVIDHFESTDILNPVYMMAFSGARGNISQVRQLVGMRGLMANPQGQIIDFPIRSNFREGLTLTEYIISSYGARKGIVDTALRTANAGYLTRRLVDVAQHVIISNFDCETRRGIFLTEMKEGNKTIYSLQNRLVGRVLARNVYALIPDARKTSNHSDQKQFNVSKSDKEGFSLIAKRNTEISLDLAFEIAKAHKKVFVRSSLTCESKKLVCQLCYGWSLAQGNLVSIGEAVGVVAAQSIGEPGTQLTMRTFHTGGVFSGDVSDQIKAPFDGFVQYDQPIAGTLIRTSEGKIAFLTKNEGSFLVHKTLNSEFENFSMMKDTTIKSKKYKIPAYTLVFKRMGEYVFEKEVIAQISSISRQKNSTDDAELTIKSDMEGQFYSKILDLQENKIGPKPKKEENDFFGSNTQNTLLANSLASPTDGVMDTVYEAWNWGYAWILSGKIYQLSFPSSFFPKVGDFVNRNTIMNQLNWKFYSEGIGNVMKLHQSLTFSHDANVKQNFPNIHSLKIKNLMVSYFKNKNSTLKGLNTHKNAKFLTKGFLNSKGQHEPPTNSLNLSSANKSLENVLNIPVITNSVLTLDIHGVFYKKNAYVMKLKNTQSSINSSNFLLNPSILSKNDILATVTSLERPQNGTSIFSNLSVKKTKIVNKELNTLANISNSFSSSNWLPNTNYFLNWYPKHSQLLTPGLIARESVLPNESSINVQKQKNEKTKVEKANSSEFPTNLSFSQETNYKLQLKTKFQHDLTQSIRLKNLDFNLNTNNFASKHTTFGKPAFNKLENTRQSSKKSFQKNSIKRMNAFKANKTSILSNNSFVSSIFKKEFVTKFLKDDKTFKNSTKNLIMSLSKQKIKPPTFFSENSKSSFLDPSLKKKQNIHYMGEKLVFAQQDHADAHLNKLFFALRWKNSYVYKMKPMLESTQTLRKTFFEKHKQSSINLFAKERTLSRIFVVPQIFYQLNSTFSTFFHPNIFFNSKDPIFYQINKQGHIKLFYVSQSNRFIQNLAYSLNFKQFFKKENEKMFVNPAPNLDSQKTFVRKTSIKFNTRLFFQSLKQFSLEKNQSFNHEHLNHTLKTSASTKQIYNMNQFKTFNSYIHKIHLKKSKLFKEFTQFKHNINVLKSIPSKSMQSNSLTFHQNMSMINPQKNLQFLQKQNVSNKLLENYANKKEKNSFIMQVQSMNHKDRIYFSRIFSFSNKNCTSLKTFSKKLMYLNVLKTKSTLNVQKNSSKIKNSEKTLKNLSIFNFCMLPFHGLSNQPFYGSKSKLKISNQIFLSNFICEKMSKTPTLPFTNQTYHSTLPISINYKPLCSNHDIFNISNNLLFKTRRLNMMKSSVFKSIYNLENKHGFMTFYSKKAQRHKFKKFMKSKKRFIKNNFNLSSLQQKTGLRTHLNKIPIQIKSGWVYVSPKLMDHFSMDKKFIFPGQPLCKEFVMDHQVCYLEFISLNGSPAFNKPVKSTNPFSPSKHFGHFSYEFKDILSQPKSLVYDTKSQDIKINSVTKNLKSWNWVSNKNARYVPSYMKSSVKEIKSSFKESTDFGLLIRNVYEHKQYCLNTYKRDIYNLANQQTNSVPKLNRISIKQTTIQSLNNSWYRYYLMLEKTSYQKNSLIKYCKIDPKTLKKSCSQLLSLETSMLKTSSLSQISRILNMSKKFFPQKRIFVNKLCNSLTLQHEYRSSLQNKQRRNLQILSKFPTIDLELTLNHPLCLVHEHTHYNFDVVNKMNSNQNIDISRNSQINVSNTKTNLNLGTMNQALLILNHAQRMLPFIARKAINFAPLIVSYKIPYGFHRIFNTDLSLFNYKHRLTFHFQKFTKSFYVAKFLDDYVQKLCSRTNRQNESPMKTNQKQIEQNTNSFFKQNPRISSEINSVIPVFFSSACFSYNLIQKLDKTFIPNFNVLNLMENSSVNNFEKLRLFSKKIEIKNQFFTFKDNKFRSSDCLGKTSSYCTFEGEMIYKKDLTLLHGAELNLFNNSKSKQKIEQSLDSFFPLTNPYSALILTKQDLIAFSFQKIKKHSFSNATSNLVDSKSFEKINQTINPQSSSSKKQYYINDILIKFQKMNSAVEESPTANVEDENNLTPKTNQITMESIIKINKLSAGLPVQKNNLLLGEFFMYGDKLKNNVAIFETGQIVHIGKQKVTLRRGQPIFVSPKAILHKYDGDFVEPKASVITLAYSQLKTGDIIQGIPKVEQFFEARTTKRGRLFRDSLPNLLKGLFKRYVSKFPLDKAVRQSFYKIQQIIVDGVQRVYRAQGAGIADKHLEIIVKQMTSKVRITQGAQTGFFAGEIVDLDLVEQVNSLLMKKIQYEPLVLGITKASLEVDSFLSAASFQQTTRVLSKAAMGRKKDFLKGLKENVILGNLIPAGTGYLVSLEK